MKLRVGRTALILIIANEIRGIVVAGPVLGGARPPLVLKGRMSMKRGTRIEYRYAGGLVVPGKVVRTYNAKEIAAHAKSHGAAAAAALPEWIVCELHHDDGNCTGACHVSQLRVTDNRVLA